MLFLPFGENENLFFAQQWFVLGGGWQWRELWQNVNAMLTAKKRWVITGVLALLVLAGMLPGGRWWHFGAGVCFAVLLFTSAGHYVVALREKRYQKWFSDAYTTDITDPDSVDKG